MEINQLCVGVKYWLKESPYSPVPYTVDGIDGIYYAFQAESDDFVYK